MASSNLAAGLARALRMLTSPNGDLRHLAILSGREAETFYEYSDLQGVDLSGQDLRGMSFRGADLRRSILSDAKWDPGAFHGAKLPPEVALSLSPPFRGHALRVVDGDGRVVLPAALRRSVGYSNSHELVLTPNRRFPCIVAYDPLTFELRTSGAPVAEGAHSLGVAVVAPYDKRGRLCLPAFLRSAARIADRALFVAFGNGFEIWNPRLAIELGDENLRALARKQVILEVD